MTTTRAIRSFRLTSILFVGAVALAATASGCFGGPGNGYGNGNGYGGSCPPDLFVDWQIQNSAGASVTCAGAGAATVDVTVSAPGYSPPPYPQVCVANQAYSSVDLILPGAGTYDITVGLFDATGNSLAPAQSVSLNINSCGSYETPGPALLVVSPPAS